MPKPLYFLSNLLLGCSLIALAHAENTTHSTASNSKNSEILSKEDWFKYITPLLPDLICKGFENDVQLKKRFNEIKMSYKQCMEVLPKSISICQQELYAGIPDQMSDKTVDSTAKSLAECIGKDFALKYLIPKPE